MTKIKCRAKKKSGKAVNKAGKAKLTPRAKPTHKVRSRGNVQSIEKRKNIEKAKNIGREENIGNAEKWGAEDFVRVRESISALVRKSATRIVENVIEVAASGQLAPAKYLFEAIGLYPPTAETLVQSPENSLAYTLLKRMGLPTEPSIFNEGADPGALMMKPDANKAFEPIRDSPLDQESERTKGC
jgi:hypothetical protein